MKIAVTSEYHFRRGPDGVLTDAAYPYEFWTGLREVFDEVVVIARVGDAAGPGGRRADGPGVRFAAVPEFVGAAGLARAGAGLARVVLDAVGAADVVLLRAPGVMAVAAHAAARLRGRPHGVEVVGDPIESLTTASPTLARLAGASAVLLRAQVRGAIATRYVTATTLQRRYPPPSGRFTTAASDLVLPDRIFDEAPVAIRDDGGPLSLIWVGPLARPYKGVDVLLAALARTARPHRLTLVGDGALRPALTTAARELGLGDRVAFTGTLAAGGPVFARLREADLFVLPSRTEGLPRALLEAMAFGLPCLATPVGGVPELLAPEALVAVDDVAGLAAAIDALAADPARRRALAAANRERARGFRASIRTARMAEFYRALRSAAGAPRRRA